jgi:hypothetical protein
MGIDHGNRYLYVRSPRRHVAECLLWVLSTHNGNSSGCGCERLPHQRRQMGAERGAHEHLRGVGTAHSYCCDPRLSEYDERQVGQGGIEPPTPAFSGLRSTD